MCILCIIVSQVFKDLWLLQKVDVLAILFLFGRKWYKILLVEYKNTASSQPYCNTGSNHSLSSSSNLQIIVPEGYISFLSFRKCCRKTRPQPIPSWNQQGHELRIFDKKDNLQLKVLFQEKKFQELKNRIVQIVITDDEDALAYYLKALHPIKNYRRDEEEKQNIRSRKFYNNGHETYFRPFGSVVNSLSGIFAPLSCKNRSFSNTCTFEK